MSDNPLVRLGRLGQSPWYDYITRDLLASGGLARLIAEDGLRGMTSNPTIFEKAISGSEDYDADIRGLTDAGKGPAEVFEALAVADVQAACEVFLPLYETARGADGLVSIEVNPELARDTAGTIAEAARLWAAVARPNAMVKIPGTAEGLAAIEASLAAGINVNVTLLFAVSRYEAVIEAFLRGLERRLALGHSIDRIASVASFFVSRVDTRVDALLDRSADPGAAGLRGQAAIANAALAYAAFERTLAAPRWRALAAGGAWPQRPLWASTSVKDPRYADTHYVEPLIGLHTVTTLPPETFAAYRDHGRPALRIAESVARAPGVLAGLAARGIALEEITRELEADGVAKFSASYRQVVAGIAAKATLLHAGRR